MKSIQPLTLLLLLLTIIVQQSSIITHAHPVHDTQTISRDISPVLMQSVSGPVQVNIYKDSTTKKLGQINEFTIDHGLIGWINFTDFDLDYDGLEAYRLLLHQRIMLERDNPLYLGTLSHELSEDALRDGVIHFSYSLGNLEDLDGFVGEYNEPRAAFEQGETQRRYTIENSIEFQRGTVQNTTLFLEYEIASYKIPQIDPNDFHHKLLLNTTVFPNHIQMSENSYGDTENIFALLPLELTKQYFVNPEGHNLNLSSIPLDIYIDLNYINSGSTTISGVKHINAEGASVDGRIVKDPVNIGAGDHRFRISSSLDSFNLAHFEVTAIGYEGQIDISLQIKVKALFSDTSLYARYDYPLSPNQYLLVLAFIASALATTIPAYVEYRKFQDKLAYAEFDIVAAEFNR